MNIHSLCAAPVSKMAASAREERVRRRELKREEDERRKRKIKEEIREEAEAVEIVRRRLQRSQLEDQGVILTDEDDPNEAEDEDKTESIENEEEIEDEQSDPPSPSLEGESHFVFEEEYNLTLSTSEEEDEDSEQKTEGDEVYERTRYVEEEKARIEERMQQLYQRELQALQRERELEERRLEFERQMKADEERLRQAMKSKIKKEMYDESIKILSKLETDLLKQQNVTLEKEKEISRKEKELQRKETEWKAREVEAKRQLKMKIKRELQESTGGSFTSKKESKDPRQKKINQEKEEMIEYSDDNKEEAEPQSSPKSLAPDGKDIESSKEDKVTKSDVVPPSGILSEATRKKVSIKTDKEEDDKSKVSHVSTSKTQIKQDEAEGFILKPYVGPFSGTQPSPKHENTFEVWKLEVQSLIAMKVYSDISIVQAIWKSLRGQARNVLFNIGPSAKADDIVKRLESVYGNVASGEAVLQEFYTVHQEENESVTDWGLRLEQILQRAKEKGHVNEERKDQMLRDKFWRSLYDQNLKNATKIYHQSLTNFEKLQQKVRAEEYEMKESVAKKQQTTSQKDRKRQAQHQPQLTEMDDQLQLLKTMSENLIRMDKDIQQLKKGQSRGDWRPRRRGRGRGDRKENQTSTNKTDSTERKEIRESDKQAEAKKGPLN